MQRLLTPLFIAICCPVLLSVFVTIEQSNILLCADSYPAATNAFQLNCTKLAKRLFAARMGKAAVMAGLTGAKQKKYNIAQFLKFRGWNFTRKKSGFLSNGNLSIAGTK